MKAIQYSVILIVLFVSRICFANGGFEINEIMYDASGTDTNREWIEVQNTDTDSLDLSKWYFFTDNTKHAITALGSATVGAGLYAIIAQNPEKFKIDYPTYVGLLFDSSWTGLTNTGETIGLKDPNLNLSSSITFSSGAGGAGDGYSLQKIKSTWIGSKPTPGESNKESPKIVKEVSTTGTTATAKSKSKKKSSGGYVAQTSDRVIDLDTLPASVGSDTITLSKTALAWFGFGGLVILGSLIMIIMRGRKSRKNTDALTADDMTIVE